MIPAVIYAAKSTPDEKGSTMDQVRQVLERLEAVGGRVVVGEPFTEDDVSAFKGNRGPQLEAAMAAAIQLADEHGESELWVFHSSRLARGSGKKDEGRSLTKIHADLLARGVQLRSIEDDTFVTNRMLVSLASEISHKYSEDLSAHTRRGKRNAAEAGRWPGGQVPDGYKRVAYIDDAGKAQHRLEIDEERAPLIRRIFQMAADGHSTYMIARRLNGEGVRTLPTQLHPDGHVWTRNRIQKLLTNPAYCGRLVIRRGYADERPPVPGVWPALIPAEEFDALDVTARKYGAGRPPTRSKLALYKLATCAQCGGPMYARVSQFERQDGTRQSAYTCAQRVDGACEAPRVDAARVDNAIMANLNNLHIDVEAWQADLMRGADEQRGRVEKELADARALLTKLQQREEMLRQKWIEALEADSPKADAREEAFISVRDKRVAAEGSTKIVADRLAAVPVEPPTDEVLDLYSELARIVREGDAADLNDRLRLVFDHFLIDTVEDGVLVMPILRDDVVERFADPSGVLRVITSRGTSLMAGDSAPENAAALMLVTGDETIRRPPAKAIHIRSNSSTSATYHQAWL